MLMTTPQHSAALFIKSIVSENVPYGAHIITLNATDPDEGVNGEIVYSLIRTWQCESS